MLKISLGYKNFKRYTTSQSAIWLEVASAQGVKQRGILLGAQWLVHSALHTDVSST